ncbi:MAG: sugar ABC transporter substrate-binding protein [Planctomycetes bacterium]|nr:sugar ABC transporter substrate-binding protein [Planctomycetota bacterium]
MTMPTAFRRNCYLLLILGALLGAVSSCNKENKEKPGDAAADKSAKSIVIWWFQWAPADGLAELGKEFQAETGIAVNVEQIPLSSYQDKVFLEFGGARTRFDIVVGDSQWIGRGATKGLFVDLTDWFKSVVDLNTIHPRAAKYLCEYPEGSGRWFAAPCETDAVGVAYRKDWFDDAAERVQFKKKYGRELAVPATWDEFKQTAEFFHRPDQKRYGCAMPSDREYDGLTMGVQNLLWAFGGRWHSEENNNVKGFLDTPASAAAVDFFRDLTKLGPKGAERLNYGQVLESFTNGSTAMILNYFAFFPGIYKQFGERVGFAVVPGKDGKRVASLGGQGMSISTKIPPEQQELAKKFIAWFSQRKIQEKWITKPAGFTANTEVLKSTAFRAQTPYNGPFADSVETMRDFWNVPVYNELLAATQRYVGMAVDGEMPTAQALAKLAEEKERILTEAGLLK